MRDLFTGYEGAPVRNGRPVYWNWLNLGTAKRVTVDGTPFDAKGTAVEKVVQSEQMPALTGRTVEMTPASASRPGCGSPHPRR